MKQILCLLIPLLFAGGRSVLAESSGPEARAARDFVKREGDRKDQKWYKIKEGFLAEFDQAGHEGQYFYDRRGDLRYSIVTFSGEKGLPEEVRRMVKSSYFDFSIGWVKKVTAVEDFSYIVHVENATSWKDIVVHDGEMREWQAFDKIN
jgi:hypothetical protein